MIKEKYTQLLLSHQIRGIITIGDTNTLWLIVKNEESWTIDLYQEGKNDY